jgi:hypothetical protein
MNSQPKEKENKTKVGRKPRQKKQRRSHCSGGQPAGHFTWPAHFFPAATCSPLPLTPSYIYKGGIIKRSHIRKLCGCQCNRIEQSAISFFHRGFQRQFGTKKKITQTTQLTPFSTNGSADGVSIAPESFRLFVCIVAGRCVAGGLCRPFQSETTRKLKKKKIPDDSSRLRRGLKIEIGRPVGGRNRERSKQIVAGTPKKENDTDGCVTRLGQIFPKPSVSSMPVTEYEPRGQQEIYATSSCSGRNRLRPVPIFLPSTQTASARPGPSTFGIS